MIELQASNQGRKKHRVVLIGSQGVGKTTLLNQITGSSEDTMFGGDAVTNHLFLKGSQYGRGFDVLDTPGFGVFENKFQHSACLVAALTEGPVSRICIVTEGKRTDLVLKDAKQYLQYCSDYRDLVTIVVTHMDLSKERRQSLEKQIEEKLRQFQFLSVIFTSKEDESEEICKKFDIMLKKAKSKILTFQLYDIHKKFEAFDLTTDQEKKIELSTNQIKDEFQKCAALYLYFIRKQKNEIQVQNVLHNLIVYVTNRALNLIDKFQKEYAKDLNDQFNPNGFNLQYLHQIMLKREIWGILQEVIDSAQLKMKEYGGHFYNCLRKCPSCGEVWLNVEKCEGLIRCGNLPKKRIDPLIFQEPGPMLITFQEKSDSFEIENMSELDWFQIQTKKFKYYIWNQNSSTQSPLIGCGFPFEWKYAPRIDEETIKDVLNPELAHFFSQYDYSETEIQSRHLENAFNNTFQLQVQKSMQEMKKQ